MTLLAWIVVCFLPALTGIFFTDQPFYARLRKPPLSPPAWLFGPVWSVLYLLMGISAWLVFTKSPRGNIFNAAIAMMLVQLVLNALWTPIFFGMHRIGLALAELMLLWSAVVVTLGLFFYQLPLAGILLLPYLAWVSFAAYLNYSILKLNPGFA